MMQSTVESSRRGTKTRKHQAADLFIISSPVFSFYLINLEQENCNNALK